MSTIFTASARNMATSDAPAAVGPAALSPIPNTSAKPAPAQRVTNPPSAADAAPLRPDKTPAMTAMTTVAMICHLRTVRIGLVLSGGVTRKRPVERLRKLQTGGL